MRMRPVYRDLSWCSGTLFRLRLLRLPSLQQCFDDVRGRACSGSLRGEASFDGLVGPQNLLVLTDHLHSHVRLISAAVPVAIVNGLGFGRRSGKRGIRRAGIERQFKTPSRGEAADNFLAYEVGKFPLSQRFYKYRLNVPQSLRRLRLRDLSDLSNDGDLNQAEDRAPPRSDYQTNSHDSSNPEYIMRRRT